MVPNFASFLGFAFLGGLILNIMPCVLPVLTLKVFHSIEHLGEPGNTSRAHGFAYAAGCMAAFALLGGVVIAVKASGQILGWGMHFRYPPFLATLTALIFIFGLNALGVFELQLGASGVQRRAQQGRVLGSFLSGIFAAVMSTPCTAPFLGTAAGLAVAIDTSAAETMALFITIGAGLATPFTLVAMVPPLGRLLPRPGAWMETFKHVMGFTLLATAVWLFGALKRQITASSSTGFLGFMLVIAIALWTMQRFARPVHSAKRRWALRLGAIAVVMMVSPWFLSMEQAQAEISPGTSLNATVTQPILNKDGHINWRLFSPQNLAEVHRQGRPAFVDFTADWCAACQANERLILETDTVREALRIHRIPALKADMTLQNDMLDTALEQLGRSGIPAYVIYLPGGDIDLLPEVITIGMVRQHLDSAAAAYPFP